MSAPREQLAQVFTAHTPAWESAGDYGERSWIECRCGWTGETQEEADNHTIDAIMQAGWRPLVIPVDETERLHDLDWAVE